MDFCPNCGSMLFTKAIESGSQAMIILTCKRCGYKSKNIATDGKLDLRTIQHNPKQMVAVIDKEKDVSVKPTIQIDCPRCGNNTAYVWQVQTRGADESSTQFSRCTNCGYTFRENT
jgi:transcription factor S